MKHKIVSSTGSSRLILLFAGWGMDSRPFEGLSRPGYDVAVVWDYRSFSASWQWTEAYKEICVFAWSFGVYASAIAVNDLKAKVTLNIAVNGTLYPCDETRGIPPSIFEGTLQGLNEQTLAKFYRRMCGSSASYRSFCSSMPDRAIDDLREELQAFAPGHIKPLGEYVRFDLAIVGERDAIIPSANQKQAWVGTPLVILDESHLLDFQSLIDRYVVDKDRVSERFTSGLESYDSASDVQVEVVDKLEAILKKHGLWNKLSLPSARVLEIGCGTGSLSRKLDSAITDGYFEMWDLVGNGCIAGRTFRRVDAETEIAALPSNSFDFIASASTIQWFNSPLHFLEECVRVCAPGGIIALTTFVAGNLAEVTAITGRSLPLLTAEQWQESVPSGAEIVDCFSWNSALAFNDAISVFRHLKETGVNALGRTSQGESSLIAGLRSFRPDSDGKFVVTYKPLILILKKNE